MTMQYGISRTVSLPYEKAVERITEELKKEGFGVLTSIDVKETLKKKLDVDFKRYIILGACNPPFAYKVLQVDENIGLLLPCNVIVYEKGDKSVVAAFDPMSMTKLVDHPDIETVAVEVAERLKRAIATMPA